MSRGICLWRSLSNLSPVRMEMEGMHAGRRREYIRGTGQPRTTTFFVACPKLVNRKQRVVPERQEPELCLTQNISSYNPDNFILAHHIRSHLIVLCITFYVPQLGKYADIHCLFSSFYTVTRLPLRTLDPSYSSAPPSFHLHQSTYLLSPLPALAAPFPLYFLLAIAIIFSLH